MCNAIQGNILYILSEKTRRMLLRLNSATPTHTHTTPITTTPIRLSQILLRLRPKLPVEERVWFRDYRTY